MPANSPSFTDPESYTESLCEFVRTPFFRQITGGIHVNDALIHDAWGQLPMAWTEWWSSLSSSSTARLDLIDGIRPITISNNDERAERLVGDEDVRSSRPTTLAEWLSQIRLLALPRIPSLVSKGYTIPEALSTAFDTKKAVEVSLAATHIASRCQKRGITHIIDIGSGQGYLPITLTYTHPHLKVLAIDGSQKQVEGSQKLASLLQITEERLRHVLHYIDGGSNVVEIVEDWAQGEPCMLTGLHACGSLSEHMIRYFLSISCIKEIAVIGCCYNHIIRRSESVPDGFPSSQRLRSYDVDLSATALMTGCQAPENWSRTQSADGSSPFARRHFYRALLEKVFFDHGLRSNHTETAPWRIRKGDMINFEAFSRRAMNALGIDSDKLSSETLCQYETRYRGYEGRISILWTLGVLSCKIVESVVAMDRYWYIREQGAEKVDIVPIFDYAISPRNLMIIATKQE